MKVATQINVILAIIALLTVSWASGLFPVNRHNHDLGMHGEMNHMRDDYLGIKQAMQSEMIDNGDYACCLEKPCAYCIEKTPKHGEGATCDCLTDVMNGVHPCGECIGEIIEGHGNRFLAPHFAKALSEEVGEHHLETLRQIVKEKYGLAVDEQM